MYYVMKFEKEYSHSGEFVRHGRMFKDVRSAIRLANGQDKAIVFQYGNNSPVHIVGYSVGV